MQLHMRRLAQCNRPFEPTLADEAPGAGEIEEIVQPHWTQGRPIKFTASVAEIGPGNPAVSAVDP